MNPRMRRLGGPQASVQMLYKLLNPVLFAQFTCVEAFLNPDLFSTLDLYNHRFLAAKQAIWRKLRCFCFCFCFCFFGSIRIFFFFFFFFIIKVAFIERGPITTSYGYF